MPHLLLCQTLPLPFFHQQRTLNIQAGIGELLNATELLVWRCTELFQEIINHATLEQFRSFIEPDSKLCAGDFCPPCQQQAMVISVADTGGGIPEENLSKLFNPFFTTKPPGKGTGLGLSIVYGIIKMHRGQISVKSELGTGTTFTITLPVMLAKQQAL